MSARSVSWSWRRRGSGHEERAHPAGWNRCLPSEARTKGAGEWNDYRITCLDGTISLEVNGKKVSGGYDVNPRRGYICLEAEGTEIDFRYKLERVIKETSEAEVEESEVWLREKIRCLNLTISFGGRDGSRRRARVAFG